MESGEEQFSMLMFQKCNTTKNSVLQTGFQMLSNPNRFSSVVNITIVSQGYLSTQVHVSTVILLKNNLPVNNLSDYRDGQIL